MIERSTAPGYDGAEAELVNERRSWQFLWHYRVRVVSGCFALLCATSLGVVIPYVLGRTVSAIQHGDGHLVPRLAALILALALVQAVARTMGNIAINGAAYRAEHDLRMAVFRHLVATDAGYFRQQKTGDLVSRLTSDLQTLMSMWGQGIFYGFGVGLLLAFAIIAMVSIDPILTVLALAPIPPIVLTSQYLSRRIKRLGTEASRQRGKLASDAHEDLAGIDVVKGYHLEQERGRKFSQQASVLMRSVLAVQRASGWYGPLTGLFIAAGTVVVLWRGGSAVIDGSLELGDLVQFNTYLTMLGFRVVTLASIIPVFQQGVVSWQRISAVLAREPTVKDAAGPALAASGAGDLEFRDLGVEIDGRRVLDGVSFGVPGGTLTAVVGRVGAGKSTLVEAIPRLVDVPKGMLFVEGRDVTDLPLASLRGAIAYAPQHAFLFSATIAENIAFGLDQVDESEARERVVKAARIAGLESDLAALPQGIDTPVGERGVTLSGGQRQRVALARAIASERRIILLDDALSAVDTDTERRILDGLQAALRGRTVVMITHRAAAMARAQQIAVLDRGRLVELGAHDELLARNGAYAEIYRDQLEQGQAP